MRYYNETSFKAAHIAGRLNFPGHTLTLIVKGIFDLHHGKTAETASDMVFPTGDVLYPDDDEMTGGPRYEYDYAVFKPGTDLLLAGHCHTPEGKPAPACRVTFRVGPYARSLYVFGDRFWKGPPGLRAISNPEPFTSMELRYEKSFGGPGDPRNPIGKGFAEKVNGEGNHEWPLPNIEDPDHLIDSPEAGPEPAGYGPLGRMWQLRASKMGTYGRDWKEKRWPWYPEDIDMSHFNAAPPEMQVGGYLRGDEPLFFEHLHPEHPRYESRLPGLRVRCFANKREDKESDRTRFVEVPMLLDTLWADMDNEKLVLVWRGHTEVWSDEFEDVGQVYIMSEPLDGVPASPADCRAAFLGAVAAEEGVYALEPEEPGMPEAAPEAVPEAIPAAPAPPPAAEAVPPEAAAPVEEVPPAIKYDPLEVKAQAKTLLNNLGINMDAFSPEVKERINRNMDNLLENMGESDPAKLMDKQRERLDSSLNDAFTKLGLDAGNPPPLSAQARQEQIKMFQDLGVGNAAEVLQDQDVSRVMSLMTTLYAKLGFDPENLSPLTERVKVQMDKVKTSFSGDEGPSGAGSDQPQSDERSGDER